MIKIPVSWRGFKINPPGITLLRNWLSKSLSPLASPSRTNLPQILPVLAIISVLLAQTAFATKRRLACTTPATPAISGTLVVCTGSTQTLTATSGLGTYIWSSDGGTTWTTASASNTLTVSAAGTYLAAAISAGCTSAYSTPEVVTLNSTPTAPKLYKGMAYTSSIAYSASGSVAISNLGIKAASAGPQLLFYSTPDATSPYLTCNASINALNGGTFAFSPDGKKIATGRLQ